MGYAVLGLSLLATGVATAKGLSDAQQLRETGSCAGCNLRGEKLAAISAPMGNLKNADLRDADLYKADLRNADLTGAFLNGANLSAANLKGAKGADLLVATTDAKTVCPSGTNGPCN